MTGQVTDQVTGQAADLLAINAGNTHVEVGVFQGAERVHRCRFAHADTPDLNAALVAACAPWGPWQGAVMASVTPSRTELLVAACGQITGGPVRVVDHQTDLGISIASAHPEQVGSDRLVNAAMAFHDAPGAVVIVDVGTATTVCAVDAHGVFRGGAIAAGPGVAMDALSARAERLPMVPLQAPADALGDTTVAAMQAGAVIGHAGLIDRLVREMGDAIRAPAGSPDRAGRPDTVLTGGLGPLLSPHLTVPHRLARDLTLAGLAWLWSRRADGKHKGPGRRMNVEPGP